MTLFIGAYFPERQLQDSGFNQAVTQVAVALAANRQSAAQQARPDVDLHFLLPGETDAPEFTGMRYRSYDTDNKTLCVEAAVPATMLNSSRAQAYVLAVIEDAIDNARDFFLEVQQSFEYNHYRQLVADMSQKLSNS